MQPYFLPYTGYFRLLAGTDMFVIYDSVQFPRRGWVHRNRLKRDSGELDWLTLPLAYAPRETLISKMVFHHDADRLWESRLRGFPASRTPVSATEEILENMRRLEGTPLSYLVRLIEIVSVQLGLSTPMILASEINTPSLDDTMASRIIAICRELGATHYLNAPGGSALYDQVLFASKNIELEFLPEYKGNKGSILERLHNEPAQIISKEIDANM